MAGIFAYSSVAPNASGDELLRIRECMHSGGPDGAGLWIAKNRRIALAHRRLAIIDLSDAGAQPMLDPDIGNRMIFNREIYNYKALQAELEGGGERFRSHSNTEVLLKPLGYTGAVPDHRLDDPASGRSGTRVPD